MLILKSSFPLIQIGWENIFLTDLCRDKKKCWIKKFGVLIFIKLFSTKILSDARIWDEKQLLDSDHAHSKPRPSPFFVSSQPREQDLHRGPHPRDPASGEARGLTKFQDLTKF